MIFFLFSNKGAVWQDHTNLTNYFSLTWKFRCTKLGDSNLVVEDKVIPTKTPGLIYSFSNLSTCILNVVAFASNPSWASNVSVQNSLEVISRISVKSISIATPSCKVGSYCSIQVIANPDGMLVSFP